MPPFLALSLCTVFVLYLLWLDSKQTPGVSFALWIPTIWMLSIAGKPLSYWFLSTGGDTESGNQLDQAFLVIIFCLGLLILASRKRRWAFSVKSNISWILLIGFMLLSIVWSDISYTSFKRWFRELIAVVMAFVVMTEQEPRKAMQSLICRTVYILIPFSLILIKYFPEYGVQYARWSGELTWIGVDVHKNGLGRLCIIAAFFQIWTLVRRWKGRDEPASIFQTPADVVILLITLWLLKGPPNAYSATAIGAMAGGLLAYIYLSTMREYRVRMGANMLTVLIALVIVYGILAPMYGGLPFETLSTGLGRDETLTGRTDVWAVLFPIAMQQPIVGHGFGSFWTPFSRELYRISEAHSGYLEVMLELGFVGIVLFSAFLLSSCRKAQRELAHDFDWGSLYLCYIVMAVLHNITESSLNTFSSHLTAVLLFMCVTSSATIIKQVGPNIRHKIT